MGSSALTLKTIKRWYTEAVDRDYYDKLYVLQLFAAGDYESMTSRLEGGGISSVWSSTIGSELPNYPEILPRLGPEGIQNHGLINARINVQGVSMEPELTFLHNEPLIREINASFIRERWTTQGWSDAFYMTGMEVEICGLGVCMAGISDKKVNWRHIPILDVIWDRAHREPKRWRWVCSRNRLTPEEAKECYPCLSDDDLHNLTHDDDRLIVEAATTQSTTRRVRLQLITEWSFYTKDHHVVFLGNLAGDVGVPLVLNERNEYNKVKNDEATLAGPNPFGVMPFSFWIDSWAPGIQRPVAKTETTMRIAKMLNEVEQCMMEYVRSTPITAVDGNKIDPKMHTELLKMSSFEGLKRLLVTKGGSIKDVISRTDPLEIPNALVTLRNVLKEELNAATGVQDMMRGQALSGEKTMYEVKSLDDQAGIQGRHLHSTFASFVVDVVTKTRTIAAEYDTAPTVLQLENGPAVDTKIYPVKPFMTEYVPCQIDPSSLVFRTEADRKQEALVSFTNVFMPLMQLHAVDPVKVLVWIGKKLGIKDPKKELGIDPVQAPMGGPGGAPPPPGGMPPPPGSGGVPMTAPPMQMGPGTMPPGGPPPPQPMVPAMPVHSQ
jgi:hypothetical protein